MTISEVIHLIVVLAMIVLLVVIIIDFIWRFTHVPHAIAPNPDPTFFQRLLSAGRGSLTFWWGRFVTLIGAFFGVLAGLSDYFNEPTIADGIRTYLSPHPEYVAIFVVLVGVITVWVRKRTLTEVPPSDKAR